MMGRPAGRSALLLLLCLLVVAGAAVQASPAADAAAPASCAEGPTVVGATIQGTPCDDTIVVPAWIASVDGGGGDDTIRAAPIAAATTPEQCPGECHLDVGSQTFEGGPGDDVVFGERGNDILNGNAGNDRLFGGIGDDLLRGGPGNDRLSGGFGADSIDGEAGDDYVRGDGTIDHIRDTGGGIDTLSYATGVTPGFPDGFTKVPPYPDFSDVTGFPDAGEERGVYLDLGRDGENGDNGVASFAGGVDEVEEQDVEGRRFEVIVGSAFSDYIVGSGAGETIYGGGGADALLGEGGDDVLRGGADGDLLDGGGGVDQADGEAGADNCQNAETATSCEGTATAVDPRESGEVSVGFATGAASTFPSLYVVGSSGTDSLTASYAPAAVTFTLTAGSFDQSAEAGGGCSVGATSATCSLLGPLDSLMVAGMGGDDTIVAANFPSTVGLVLAGGADADTLSGGAASEDVLVDGPGAGKDVSSSLGGDDALLHNGGPDELSGGDGNDLFLSVSICDGEKIQGGADRDNSSWARLAGEGVTARLDEGRAGEVGPGVAPVCPGDAFDSLEGIEDLEGSASPDVFFGDAGPNQLLGHKLADVYSAGAGADTILANSGDADTAIDCGADSDAAIIDFAAVGDPAPVNCERVREGAPNDFRTITELPPPPPAPELPPPPEPPPPPPVDRKPPQTRILFGPPRVITSAAPRRRVAFRFTSNEPGSHFLCKLDTKPYRSCTSPRAYRVGSGRHVVRIVAIDAAGNRDGSPALFRFRVRRT